MTKTLCVIPARSGSVGVKNKNLRLLGNVPLTVHTVEFANAVSAFDEVCLSSNSTDILKLATGRCRAIRRPDEISTSCAPSESAIFHALDYYSDTFAKDFEYVVLLEPTSPFRTHRSVQKCLTLLYGGMYDTVCTVANLPANVGYVDNGVFVPIQKERRRQDRKPFYSEAGVFYGASVERLRRLQSFRSENWGAVILDYQECFDINSEQDLQDANRMWENVKNENF